MHEVYSAEMFDARITSSVRTIITTNQAYHLDIWRDVMERVHKELNLPIKGFSD
jgi:hypothetical protein